MNKRDEGMISASALRPTSKLAGATTARRLVSYVAILLPLGLAAACGHSSSGSGGGVTGCDASGSCGLDLPPADGGLVFPSDADRDGGGFVGDSGMDDADDTDADDTDASDGGGGCPDDYPIMCPQDESDCWPSGTVCSSLADCGGDAGYEGCGAVGSTFDCATSSCDCDDPSHPVYCDALGTVPASCWSTGTACGTVTSCPTGPQACTSASDTVDCSTDECTPSAGSCVADGQFCDYDVDSIPVACCSGGACNSGTNNCGCSQAGGTNLSGGRCGKDEDCCTGTCGIGGSSICCSLLPLGASCAEPSDCCSELCGPQGFCD